MAQRFVRVAARSFLACWPCFFMLATSCSSTSGPQEAGAGGNPAPVSTISKDGITWTFSAAVPAGQFVNGDWYVVGPVTVTAIDPAPTTSSPYLNGTVLNMPTSNGKSGFDSRLNDGSDTASGLTRFPASC